MDRARTKRRPAEICHLSVVKKKTISVVKIQSEGPSTQHRSILPKMREKGSGLFHVYSEKRLVFSLSYNTNKSLSRENPPKETGETNHRAALPKKIRRPIQSKPANAPIFTVGRHRRHRLSRKNPTKKSGSWPTKIRGGTKKTPPFSKPRDRERTQERATGAQKKKATRRETQDLLAPFRRKPRNTQPLLYRKGIIKTRNSG